MKITIRDFRLADQKMVKNLVLQGLREHFGRINPNLNPDLDDINRNYILVGHSFVVAELDGEIVGTAALVNEKPKVGRIVRVTVAPQHRRAGIGRQLVEHLINKAVEMQFSQLLVETNLDWYDAIRLYQRCGFKEYDRDMESVYLFLSI